MIVQYRGTYTHACFLFPGPPNFGMSLKQQKTIMWAIMTIVTMIITKGYSNEFLLLIVGQGHLTMQ